MCVRVYLFVVFALSLKATLCVWHTPAFSAVCNCNDKVACAGENAAFSNQRVLSGYFGLIIEKRRSHLVCFLWRSKEFFLRTKGACGCAFFPSVNSIV